jgi:hypothetical protein
VTNDDLADPPDDRDRDRDRERDEKHEGERTSRPSEPPGRRRRLEGVIPDLIKRAVEIGVEKATEAPESIKHFVTDMKMPKEVATYILGQVEDTKNGVFRVVAKEMRDFLEHTNLAGEMQKMLTTLQFEINTTIRFQPNDGKPKADDDAGGEEGAEGEDGKEGKKGEDSLLPKPEVKMDVFTRNRRRRGHEER